MNLTSIKRLTPQAHANQDFIIARFIQRKFWPQDYSDFIKTADLALNKAKMAGTNCYVV